MTTYRFSQWEDGSTNRVRTIMVTTDMSIVAYYVEVTAPPSPCFIATAAYGSPLVPQLSVLRRFRDRCLPDSIVGLYYHFSPPFADFIRKHTEIRSAIRAVIDLIVKALK